ncbi:MAG: hypothetical protein GMKNLPBB_01404 [Myxococcota bacterium]|nr:hypothetical protein [Myxococcota bacterium]
MSGVVWNRIDDAVRWATHELRRLCPEPEFGSRSIARHLVRAGIQISRSTIQRVIREPKPVRPKRPKALMGAAQGVAPHHLLNAQSPNRVWHLDLTTLRVLWLRFTVAALLDGCTRRLLRLKVYGRTPGTRHILALVHSAIGEFDAPQFVITDHGSQFRRRFRAAMTKRGIRHVRGRVRMPFLNGKCECWFKTFRVWWRLILSPLTVNGIQVRLDCLREWYNDHRPHSAIRGMAPTEAWNGTSLPEPIPIRARDQLDPAIDVCRRRFRSAVQILSRPASPSAEGACLRDA